MNGFYDEPGFFSIFEGAPFFFNIFFFGILGTIITVLIVTIVKGISTWSSNNASEVLRRPSKVIDKRTKVWGGSGDSSAKTSYYLTFEFEDLSRIELQVKAEQYGLTVVGDTGELVYQGTRFKEFTRMRVDSYGDRNNMQL